MSGRAPLAAWLAACALFAAGGVLLLPSRPSRPAVRALLVDASDSVVAPRPGWAEWLRRALAEEAAAAASAGEECLLIAFAEEVRRLYGPAPADELAALAADSARWDALRRATAPSGGGGAASSLAGALAAAEAVVGEDGRERGTVVVLGDGSSTGAAPETGFAALARAGAALRERRVGPCELDRVVLQSLALPPLLPEGAPVAAQVELALERGSRGDGAALFLACTLTNAGAERRFERAVDWPGAPGAARVRLAVDLGPARAGEIVMDVELVLRGEGGGVLAADPAAAAARRRSARGRVSGRARLCALVADDAAARAAAARLGALLAPQGVDLRAVTAAALPGELALADALLTLDADFAELPRAAVEALLARGGGWLHLGAASWLAAPTAGSARELLPLAPRGAQRGERDVVLLVDGSGSMSEGEAGATAFDAVRAAAAELALRAPVEDRIELRFFTDQLQPGEVLREATPGAAADPAALRAGLARLASLAPPGGSTEILRSLAELAAERRSAGRRALVFLLSDGREQGDRAGVLQRAGELRAALADAGIELAACALGERADPGLLAALLAPGEALLDARDAASLSAAFVERAHAHSFVEPVELAVVAGGPLALEIWGTAGAAPGAGLALTRAVRCVLSSGAELALAAGEPAAAAARATGAAAEPGAFLALARRGGGLTAALASAPRAGFAPELAEGELLSRTLAPLAAWLCRGARANVAALALAEGLLALEAPAELALPALIELELAAPGRVAVRAELGLASAVGPVHTWHGTAPPELESWPADADAWARVVRPDSAPLALALELPPPVEWRWPPRAYALPGAYALRGDRSAAAGAAVPGEPGWQGTRGRRAWAAGVLVLGSLVLACAVALKSAKLSSR